MIAQPSKYTVKTPAFSYEYQFRFYEAQSVVSESRFTSMTFILSG
jgi:hypothetical protein